MLFPIAIESGDEKTAFGVVVPDLPGCFSAGDTLEEAIANVREAIALHLLALVEEGKQIPQPIFPHPDMQHVDYRGWLWYLVRVPTDNLVAPSVRVNVTIPKNILRDIDLYAKMRGKTRSAFLTEAAQAVMTLDA